ncbi:MAG: TonB-dependent receptor [Alphaproteobacteria bacterium]
MVFQPEQIKGLAVTLDYYDIKVDNAIALRPAQDIINGCYNPARNTAMSAAFSDCTMLHRNTANGTFNGDQPVGVDQINSNIAEVRTKGIDYGIAYKFDLGPGALSLALNGTHVDQASYVPAPGVAEVECAGYYGKACGIPSTLTSSAGGPTPKDHFTQRTSYDFNAVQHDFEVGYYWRHLSSVDIVPAEASGTTPTPVSEHIKAFDYLDLDASISVVSNVKLRLGVVNLFNRGAPQVNTATGSTPYNSGNTYPSTYDVLGRIYQVGFTAKF